MAYILTKLGSEWGLKNALEGVAVDFLLYNSSDAIGNNDDLAAITTEPNDGNYARVAATLTLVDQGDDWAAVTSALKSFDVTNTTGLVDSYAIVANFQAETTGDASAQDHLVATGSLSQEYDLQYLDTLNISQGTQGVKLT